MTGATDSAAGDPATPRSRRLVDEATGQPVQLIYALPPELLGDVSPARDEVSLADLARRLWRRRRGIGAIVAAAIAIAVVVALAMRPTYTASVTAMPPAQRSGGALGGLGQYADLASLAGISLPSGGGSAAEEIMAILNSRTLHQRLVEQFALREHFDAELLEDALKRFGSAFTATYDKKADTIAFSLTTHVGTAQIPDTQKLAAIVNRAAIELQSIFNGIHQSASRREREFLETRQHDVETELSRSQEALATFQREHGAIQIESQVKATVEAISALEGQMIGQQVELRALLASQASADNPNIHLLQERISGLNDAIKKLSGPTAAGGDDGSVLLGLASMPELGIRYVNLFREVKKNEAILQALLGQVEAARFNELRSAEVINIIDPALPPERRTAPKRSLIVVLGALLGAIAALAWALAADPLAAWWRTVRVEAPAAATPAPA